jgi:hypothetical protein
MKIKFYCDSGANIHSRREEIIDTADLGLEEGEWEKLTDKQKEEHVQDWNSGHLEYGWMDVS